MSDFTTDYLIGFESGKILVLPGFIPVFETETDVEIFFIDSQVEKWDYLEIQDKSLLISDGKYLYSYQYTDRS